MAGLDILSALAGATGGASRIAEIDLANRLRAEDDDRRLRHALQVDQQRITADDARFDRSEEARQIEINDQRLRDSLLAQAGVARKQALPGIMAQLDPADQALALAQRGAGRKQRRQGRQSENRSSLKTLMAEARALAVSTEDIQGMKPKDAIPILQGRIERQSADDRAASDAERAAEKARRERGDRESEVRTALSSVEPLRREGQEIQAFLASPDGSLLEPERRVALQERFDEIQLKIPQFQAIIDDFHGLTPAGEGVGGQAPPPPSDLSQVKVNTAKEVAQEVLSGRQKGPAARADLEILFEDDADKDQILAVYDSAVGSGPGEGPSVADRIGGAMVGTGNAVDRFLSSPNDALNAGVGAVDPILRKAMSVPGGIASDMGAGLRIALGLEPLDDRPLE